VNYLNEVPDYARFVDGKWEPIITTSTVVEKTVMIGGSNPMPRYLYAALVTDLGSYMRKLSMVTAWRSAPYETYLQEIERLTRECE
jgi:hypothetical protein